MCTVRNQLHFCSSRLYHQRIKMGVFVFFACVTYQAGFNQQEFAYANPEKASASSIDSEGLKNSNEQVFSIMKQQLRSYQQKLEESERRLQDFQRKHGIILLETQMNHLLEQRKALDNSLMAAEEGVKGFQVKLVWVKEQISQVPKEIPLSSSAREQGVVGGAKANLLGLQLQEQQLLNKYTENNPLIHSLRKEMELINAFIKEQEAQLARSVSSGKNPVYAEMEMQLFHTQADLVSAEAQSEVIQRQIAEIDQELDRLKSLGPELNEFRRQVTADEKNYINYLTKVGKTPPQDYQIQVGDQLDIKFFFNPELNETVLVRPDGRIALQLIGELPIVGKTVKHIRTILMENYSGQLKNPEVAVILRSTNVPGEEISPTGGEGNPGGRNAN